MKPSPFEISRPGTLDAAQAALRRDDHGTKLISGGQSLGPMLNLRLARPAHLVDVTALPGLADIRETDSHVEIGAAVTHARIEDGEVPDPIPGMLRHIASGIAYRAVRNKGTIGGSLCHADPAADWVTAITALGAVLVVRGSTGAREIAMAGFMLGAYRTAMAEDEVLTTIRVPRYSDQARWGYYKICRKVGEFADAIAAFVADPESRTCRAVFGSTGGAPLVSTELARQIATTGAVPPLDTVKTVLRDSGLTLSDVKIHQLAIAHSRAVTEALSDA